MSITQKIILCMLMIGTLTLLTFAQVRTADFKIHDRGDLWETMKDDGTIGAPNPYNRYEFYPSMDWPGGPHTFFTKDDQRSYMVGAGIWIGWKNGAGTVNFSENGPLSGIRDEGQFSPILEIENFSENPGYDVTQAEEIIIAEWTTPQNIHVRRSSKVWSYPGLNRSIIIEYEVSNQTGATIYNSYVGFPYLIRPSYQDMVAHNGWGDDVHSSDESVAYDSTRALLYAYDNDPDFPGMEWDIGNYWQDYEELRTPGYAGFALLHADPADGELPQPANVFWAHLIGNSTKFTLFSTTTPNLYAILSGADRSLQAGPEARTAPIMLLACGPYTLTAGETVRFAIVEAVEGLALEETIGLSLQEYPAVQEKLPQGLGMLQTAIDNAIALYENNGVIAQAPPPSPPLEIVANPSQQSITLTWDAVDAGYVDPLTGAADFQEYQIFRSERSFIGPYTKIKSRIRPGSELDVTRYYDSAQGKWIYEDKSIQLGVGYFYAIISADKDGNQSWFTNRNEIAVKASSLPAENTLEVRVFPNPFREVSGFPATQDANSIVWTNLPAICTVRIYTANGELIRTLRHDNALSGEEIWDQLTEARQRSAPGIYFWTVESSVGNAQGSLIIIK